MIQSAQKETYAKIILILFSVFSLLWFYSSFFDPESSLARDVYANLYGFIALAGGICGIIISKKWGGFKSLLGKAILFFSFGLLAQEFGQLSYNYYIYVLGTEVPYPSLGDIGFLGYVPLYMYGMFLLGQAAGIKVSLRTTSAKLFTVITPVLVLIVTLWFFLNGYEFDSTTPLIGILDIGYIVGQAFSISALIVIYVLSRKYLGGLMRSKILFLMFAYFMQYASDFTFLYQIHRGTFEIGGLNEYMYLFSYFLMAIGLIQLKTVSDGLRSKE